MLECACVCLNVIAPVPTLTLRDIRLPSIPGMTLAAIGVRNGGKTSFLQHRMVEQIEDGMPRAAQFMLDLKDERLIGMTAADLGWLLDL